MMFKLLGMLVCVSFVCGCHTGGASTAGKTNYYYEDEDASKAAQKGQAFEDPSKVSSSPVTKAQVNSLEAQQQKLADLLAERPKSVDLQKQFVDQTDDLAHKEMDCDELTPHEKYSSALKYFRQVLKVDPKNEDAQESADTIVAIYKQMGRPVPK